MNVGEDVNIIALAKVIKEDELEIENDGSGEAEKKGPEPDDGQEQMKL